MTLHEKLLALANRLSESGQKEDAATVYSAAFQLAPGPTPTIETLDQPVPGLYHHFPCYLGCGRELRTKLDRRTIEGWDWFTQYGEQTVHFCPQCRSTRRAEITKIWARLSARPANYPDETVKLDETRT